MNLDDFLRRALNVIVLEALNRQSPAVILVRRQ